MKKYVSPQVEFIKLGAQNVITASPECSTNTCPENYVCTEDSTCPGHVCPSMYGGACAGWTYNN